MGWVSTRKLGIVATVLFLSTLSGCGSYDNPVSSAPNRPFNPIPSDGAKEVRPDATLSWRYTPSSSETVVDYDVYYGTGSTLILAGSNLEDTVFTPPLPWEDNSSYRWKVVAHESGGSTSEGAVWRFSTIYGGTWTESYPLSSPAPRLYRALELSDGNLIAAGESVTDESTSEMLVLCIDKNGSLLWDSLYADVRTAADIALDASDGIVAVGHHASRGIAVRLNSNGVVQWTRSYGTNSSRFDAVLLPSSGGYLFGGTHWNGTNADAWLVRTDDEGTVIWNRMYGSSTTADSLFDLIETSDGGFAFCGVYGSSQFVLRTNAIGAEQWRQTGSGTEISPGLSLVQDSDSSLAVLVMEASAAQGPYSPRLRRFLLEDGSIPVGFSLPGKIPIRRGQLIADDDGGVTAVYTALSDFAGNDGPTPAMRLVRLSPLGLRMWVVDYNAYDPTWGYGLLQLAEGNYIGVGATRGSPTADIEPFVVKTTYDGTQHPQ